MKSDLLEYLRTRRRVEDESGMRVDEEARVLCEGRHGSLRYVNGYRRGREDTRKSVRFIRVP